ncbi:MAG TPA: CHRD domain-containing protein [Burkholderiales bacterium]|nr:CHRD domain-containing protein [Burkholderiales bacterium]
MTTTSRKSNIATGVAFLLAGALTAGAVPANAVTIHVTLSGDQEVPPVRTAASGEGSFSIGDDRSVSGSVTTKGVKGTMAHIHEAAPGQNGGVAVPLTRKSGDEWTVPAGARLTDEQFEAFKAGNLYVNVHSDANKGGEIRGQLKP